MKDIRVGSIEELHDVLSHELGWNDHNMRRDRPYSGQPHTVHGVRGSTEVRGVTFRDIRDCYIRAVFLSTGGERIGDKCMRPFYDEALKGENAVLCENDLYGWDMNKLDPIAVAQNQSCEIERIMGIFPNVPELRGRNDGR